MYDAQKIEKKWREHWEKTKLYKTKDSVKGNKNFYHLVMFPYPSGDLHIGHWYNFAPADVYARLKRMQGFNVLSPIGFDAFGLPAENAAIKNKIHPKIWTYKNIEKMRRQLKSMGNVYDFSREVITADPEYYKWTQWMFLKMYEAGLAYRKKALANWCPKDQAILANEQVIDGKCWRHPDTLVIQKEIEQWMFKITDYAEDLIDDLEKLNWPERTKLMQKNWIGKSKGATVQFSAKGGSASGGKITNYVIPVFTTRPDTLFGATYLVLSPEHPLVEKITYKEQKEKVRHYIANAHLKTKLERTSLEKEKTGVFTGSFAVNPANNEKIPIWVSDYILMDYGTGAIMAVPAHDERDFEFAKKFNLSIIKVINPGRDWPENKPYTEGGLMVNSGEFTGLESVEGRKKITEWLKKRELGDFSTQYKLRDWIISRQRYWGAPIPIVYCKKCGIVPVPESKLPIKLPPLKNFKPVAGGKSPLARVKSFLNTKCLKCNGKAMRETDTMDTFVDSSWYYLAYVMRGISNFQFPISKYQKAFKSWLPVNMYIGGAEHTVLHLLYSRFFTKALKKLGFLNFNEPFSSLRHQGIILGSDGQKMSKSRGNVINPDDVIREYGADSMRLYEMFMGPLEVVKPWSMRGVEGVYRFLGRVWRLFTDEAGNLDQAIQKQPASGEQLKILHKTVKKVTEDLDAMRFNTAISAMMIFVNDFSKTATRPFEAMETFLRLLSPFAPHLAEELWAKLGHAKTLAYEPWPVYDASYLIEHEEEVAFQVTGKVRSRAMVPVDISEEELKAKALQDEKVKQWIEGKTIHKIIVIPHRLVNIVV